MDILFLIILSFCGLKGFFKGSLKMLFSLVGTMATIFLSYWLVGQVSPIFLGGNLYDMLYNFIKNVFDGLIVGEFNSIEELLSGLPRNLNIATLVIINILSNNITFDGAMTCGEIFAPILSKIIIKIILFIGIFIIIKIVLWFLFKFLNMLTKKCGLTSIDRILGLLVGVLKGFIYCSLIFIILSALSSLNVSSTLTSFVESGVVSSYIYNHYIANIFRLVYFW